MMILRMTIDKRIIAKPIDMPESKNYFPAYFLFFSTDDMRCL